MDLKEISKCDVDFFMRQFICRKNLSSLDVQHKEPQTIICAQLASVESESLQELSLSLEGIPEVICVTLQAQAKPLKALRLFLGKTKCHPRVLEVIPQALRLQKNLEELALTCEDLNDATEMEFFVLLRGLTQQKKLDLFVNRVSLSGAKSPTNFLVGCQLQNLEEFTFKIKCGPVRNHHENFESLIRFLAASKTLKKTLSSIRWNVFNILSY